MVAATAVADLAAQALKEVASSQLQPNPPLPLPTGWLLKESRSQPNAYYYYNQDTGESRWDPPVEMLRAPPAIIERDQNEEKNKSFMDSMDHSSKADGMNHAAVKMESHAGMSNERKRPFDVSNASERVIKNEDIKPSVDKKRRTAPTQVRVLHILKKHKDSRRPSSWRTNNKPITVTREEAVEELRGLLDILREEESNPENLIATFKELASQESDCSSAKRNGDLGMFGRKKMRPEFETAAFDLDINQLSDVVETASGAHILLRLE